MASKRVTAVLCAVAAVWAWLLLTASPASAHAQLLQTTPGNGDQIEAVPDAVTLKFSESVSPVKGGSTVVDADGKEVQDGDAKRSGDGLQVDIRFKDGVGDGIYTVSWRVVSADSHPIAGAFVFSVGDQTVAPLTGPPQSSGSDGVVRVLFWTFRWGGYAGLALMLGGSFFLLVAWPGGRTDPRARKIVRAGWITSVSAAVGSLLMQGPYSVGGSLAKAVSPSVLQETAASDYGVAIWLRLSLLAGVFLAMRWLFATPPDTRPSGRQIAVFAALGLALPPSWGLAGHANAGDLSLLALLTDAGHLLAMSVWLGGLVMLITCVLPRDRIAPSAAARVLPRFSRSAMTAVALLVTTGTFQAWREIRTIDALRGTDYGRILIFKLAAFGVLLSVGALSRSVVQRRYVKPLIEESDSRAARTQRRAEKARAEAERVALGQLRQSVRLEVGIAVAVVGLAAALVATPPGQVAGAFESAANPSGSPSAATGPFSTQLALPDGKGEVQVQLDPASTAANTLRVAVNKPDGTTLDAKSLTASFSLSSKNLGPLPADLVKQSPGQYTATSVQLPTAGTWKLDVVVRVSDFDEVTVSTEVPIQ